MFKVSNKGLLKFLELFRIALFSTMYNNNMKLKHITCWLLQYVYYKLQSVYICRLCCTLYQTGNTRTNTFIDICGK